MINLLDFDLHSLENYLEKLGEKKFRASQIWRWIHQNGISNFDLMSDLNKSLRTKLQQETEISPLKILSRHASSDGTIKWLFDVGQGNAIETVFIPEAERGTLCVSSQAGCAIGCAFCSTGHQGFSRNLTFGEIVAQLWCVEHELRSQTINTTANKNRVITNVVMMGMGEPLQNYSALLPALQLMLNDHAYGLSKRRVTVSTSGVVPMMDRLKQDCPVALAVSLHAPTDELRDKLVPLNRKYPLKELLAACERYLEYSPRKFITFEYCMLDGINDDKNHAQKLIQLIENRIPCKFNLIPFNPFTGSGLQRSSISKINDFSKILQDAGILTTIRRTRGDDIDAACGQLAGEVIDRTNMQKRTIKLHALESFNPISQINQIRPINQIS